MDNMFISNTRAKDLYDQNMNPIACAIKIQNLNDIFEVDFSYFIADETLENVYGCDSLFLDSFVYHVGGIKRKKI